MRAHAAACHVLPSPGFVPACLNSDETACTRCAAQAMVLHLRPVHEQPSCVARTHREGRAPRRAVSTITAATRHCGHIDSLLRFKQWHAASWVHAIGFGVGSYAKCAEFPGSVGHSLLRVLSLTRKITRSAFTALE
jgi:hypothetical protein